MRVPRRSAGRREHTLRGDTSQCSLTTQPYTTNVVLTTFESMVFGISQYLVYQCLPFSFPPLMFHSLFSFQCCRLSLSMCTMCIFVSFYVYPTRGLNLVRLIKTPPVLASF